MGVGDFLAADPALEEGVRDAADDRPGTDDRDLDHQVVEFVRLVARQGRHLRPALDLEDPDRVGAADHLVGCRVVGRQVGEVDLLALVAVDQGHRLLERVQHAEAEQVDLDQPQVGAVVLVPLDDDPVLHRRRFERHDLVEPSGAEHHAARVLPEVAGMVLELPPQADEDPDAPVAGIEPELGELLVHLLAVAAGEVVMPVAEALGQAVDLGLGAPQRLGRLARGHAVAVGDHVRGHRRAVPAVAPVDVLDHLLALVAGRQVDVDVRPFAAFLGQEALE